MVMVDTPQKRIAVIRQQLSDADTAEAERKELLGNRDRLHAELETLQSAVAAKELEAHRNHVDAADDSNAATVTTLRNALRQLDHKIDQLNMIIDAGQESLTEDLAEAVMAVHPDRKPQYDALQTTIQALTDWKAIIDAVLASASKMDDELQMSVNFREERYRRGFLGFIFGRSPRAVINHHLKVVVTHADHLIDSLTPLPSVEWHAPPSEQNPLASGMNLLAQLKERCEDIVQRRDDRWSFKQFDEIYPGISKAVSQVRVALDEHQTAIKSLCSETQGACDALLEAD